MSLILNDWPLINLLLHVVSVVIHGRVDKDIAALCQKKKTNEPVHEKTNNLGFRPGLTNRAVQPQN